MTRPTCYNRPPRPATYRLSDGTEIPWFSPDRCATWDGRGIGPNGEPYPAANGWNCAGCKWAPESITLPVNTGPMESTDK